VHLVTSLNLNLGTVRESFLPKHIDKSSQLTKPDNRRVSQVDVNLTGVCHFLPPIFAPRSIQPLTNCIFSSGNRNNSQTTAWADSVQYTLRVFFGLSDFGLPGFFSTHTV
jgi:hypothetical protein